MQALSDLSNKILTNVVLASIKAFVNGVLLSYPVNVLIVLIVLGMVARNLYLKNRGFQKEMTNIKGEINVMKSK
jgi:hypothetical protein